MSGEERKAAIDGLNGVAREMEHWAFRDELGMAKVEHLRDRVLDGLKLIDEQENIIKALMGDYGDVCDADGCGG